MAKRPVVDLGYEPRKQFLAFHARKQRWACIVAHRRCGKSVACVMDLIDAALRCKKVDGRFSYVGPTYQQTKATIWMYLKRFTAPIPGIEQRESDLMVVLPNNGAHVRLFGADNFERLRGAYNDGLVIDEFADIDPRAWPEVLRPSLADREGWAVFIGTPKGRNSFHSIYEHSKTDPAWFSLMLKASETGVLPQSELDDMRAMLTPEAYSAELECSFDAAILGSYFGKELETAEKDGRITDVPYDPLLPVYTAWDLGISDSTAIFFFQVSRKELRVIDHYEASGHGLPHYAAVLEARGYTYGTEYLPHDAQARQLGSGRTLWETLRELTGRIPRILPQQSIMDGINAARVTLGSAWFDAGRCHGGLEALRAYRADYDERRKVFTDKPRHDWSSHCLHADTIIVTRYGMCRIMDLPPTGEVLTPCGWKPYRSPRITLRDAPLVEVAFSDGHTVRCTPDHLFLTASGWQSASDLRMGSLIQSCLTSSLSISMAASIACGRVRSICREVAQSCIAMFGSVHSALFPGVVTFTTETTIRSITPCPTWNARMVGSTYQTPWRRGVRTALFHQLARPCETPQPRGTDQRRDGYGTAGTLNGQSHGQSGGVRTFLASIAGKLRRCWSERVGTLSDSATPTVRPLIIERVRTLRERSDVWDITVPGVECFSLANGAVVHNSSDSFRYLAMAWREMQPERPKPPPVDTWARAFQRANESEVADWRIA